MVTIVGLMNARLPGPLVHWSTDRPPRALLIVHSLFIAAACAKAIPSSLSVLKRPPAPSWADLSGSFHTSVLRHRRRFFVYFSTAVGASPLLPTSPCPTASPSKLWVAYDMYVLKNRATMFATSTRN